MAALYYRLGDVPRGGRCNCEGNSEWNSQAPDSGKLRKTEWIHQGGHRRISNHRSHPNTLTAVSTLKDIMLESSGVKNGPRHCRSCGIQHIHQWDRMIGRQNTVRIECLNWTCEQLRQHGSIDRLDNAQAEQAGRQENNTLTPQKPVLVDRNGDFGGKSGDRTFQCVIKCLKICIIGS